MQAKIEDFPKVIYENLDTINQDEVALVLKELLSIVKGAKRGQSPLLNHLILVMNDIYDAF